MIDLVIIGGGPAGLSAAVNAGAEGLNVVLIAESLGGQAGDSSRIENYAGFPQGISGPELTDRICQQAMKFNVEVKTECVKSVYIDHYGRHAVCTKGDHETLFANTLLIAMGANYNKLPVAVAFEGKGVHYACNQQTAQQDKGGKETVVVGGGNSAAQACVFLSERGKRVHFIVRDKGLEDSTSAYLRDKIEATDDIVLHFECEVKDIMADDNAINTVVLSNGENINCSDVYVMIGATPNTHLFCEDLELDEGGCIVTDAKYCTSKPGVYAIGDCRADSIRRVANAVGEGAAVVAHIHNYLSECK